MKNLYSLEHLEWKCDQLCEMCESLLKEISRMKSHIHILILEETQGEQQ